MNKQNYIKKISISINVWYIYRYKIYESYISKCRIKKIKRIYIRKIIITKQA